MSDAVSAVAGGTPTSSTGIAKRGRKREIEKEKSKEDVDNANPKCTSICNGNPGGLSCGKTVLVDVYSEEHPDDVHRVYAIVDDQSNASMITNDLADKLSSTTSQPAEARRRSDTVGE